MQNRARLRGKSIHSQQSVLTDASVPLVRKTTVANRIPDEVARLASMLDEAVNTDFARNLQKLTAQTIEISKTRDQVKLNMYINVSLPRLTLSSFELFSCL